MISWRLSNIDGRLIQEVTGSPGDHEDKMAAWVI
jgi:hypothetical protein